MRCICITENNDMKLKEWADKTGVAYLTAYRWFKSGKFPVPAYQTESGTIIVEDEMEQQMFNIDSSPSKDAMSLFLRKTIEYSVNNSTVEEFAAWIISTFSLSLSGSENIVKNIRQKPKNEDIQKHFAQFIPKRDKPKPQMMITEAKDLDHLVKNDELSAKDLVDGMAELGCGLVKTAQIDGVAVPVDPKLFKELSEAIKVPGIITNTNLAGSTGGAFNRVTTPQSYAYSTEKDVACSLPISNSTDENPIAADDISSDENISGPTGEFKPTQKELKFARKRLSQKTTTGTTKRTRGRPKKSSKNQEKVKDED